MHSFPIGLSSLIRISCRIPDSGAQALLFFSFHSVLYRRHAVRGGVSVHSEGRTVIVALMVGLVSLCPQASSRRVRSVLSP